MITHLGIICDGNRRWARERGLPVLEGHKKGFNAVPKLVDAANEAGIKFITFYIFSTENWGRSADEVSHLMKLAETYILRYAKKLATKNAKMLILGSHDRISPKLASMLEKAEKITKDCTGITVCLCFNYGGKQEIADAANIAKEVDGEITPETIEAHLYHPEVPDVDMVVRTSGEERISGFMLWRVAYAEFYFLKKCFPEMTENDINDTVAEYKKRNRRFGK